MSWTTYKEGGLMAIAEAQFAEADCLIGFSLVQRIHKDWYVASIHTMCRLHIYGHYSLGFALKASSTSFVAACEQPYEHW